MTRLLSAISFTLTLGVLTASAQSDALNGIWSGHWVPEGGVRDAITVRFAVDEDQITGEIVNPENMDFDNISFDAETLDLVAESTQGESGNLRIEARIEDETRLNGTFTHNDSTGEMRLTKWTYVPRIR